MRSETGSVAVEAAFVMPVILVVMVAVAELFMIAVTRPDPTRAAAAVKSSLPTGLAERVRVEVTATTWSAIPSRWWSP